MSDDRTEPSDSWPGAPVPRRGRPRSLSREVIVSAALELLSKEGLHAVTFRRLASSVGVLPNSLYTYFASKDELLSVLLDEVLAPIVETPTSSDWRRDVEKVMEATRRVLLEHADLIPLFLTRQSVGPNAIALGDRILGDLERGGVDNRSAVQGLRALLVFAIGFAAFEVARREDPQADAREARAREAFEFASSRHERVGALAADLARRPADPEFRAGLGWILAGIAPA